MSLDETVIQSYIFFTFLQENMGTHKMYLGRNKKNINTVSGKKVLLGDVHHNNQPFK